MQKKTKRKIQKIKMEDNKDEIIQLIRTPVLVSGRQDMGKRAYALKTIGNNFMGVSRILSSNPNKPLYGDLDFYKECLNRFFDKNEYTPSTQKVIISAYQNFINYVRKGAPEKGIIKDDFSGGRVHKEETRIFDDSELEKVFSVSNAQDDLALTILKLTGIRASEFKFFNNIKHLINADSVMVTGKSSSSRQLAIPHAVKEKAIAINKELGLDKEFGPNSYQGMVSRVKSLKKKSGIDFNLHMFRAYFATDGLYKGYNIAHLQIIMGHKSISHLDPYLKKNYKASNESLIKYAKGDDLSDVKFLRAKVLYLERLLKKEGIKYE